MSLQPPSSPPVQRRLDEHRASRETIGKITRFIWFALRRHGVPACDRPDLVQEILLAALEAWPRYDAGIAAPEKWLNGIIRHHVLRRRASYAKDRLPEKEKVDQDLCEETQSAEELLMSEERRKLVHQLYQEIPFDYRDAMIAHELDGLTLEEIAVSRRIPVSTAHYRVQEGMRHLRAALTRWQAKQRQRGVLLLPLTVGALLDADRSIPNVPDDVVDLAWRIVQRTLGSKALDADMDAQGHGNGPHHEDGIDSPAPAHPRVDEEIPHALSPAAAVEPSVHLPPETAARSLLGPVSVALVVGMIAGAWLDSMVRAPRDPIAREEPPIVSAAPPVASVAISPAPSATASAAPPEPPAMVAASVGTASVGLTDFAAEQTAFDTARAAFARGKMTAAIQALEQHAQRYPRGSNALERDRMWIDALISLGRATEACQRVETFRRAYPKLDYVERLGELCSMRP
jgi:RNA polymerase sigma factor (sigma-70 family)